jgi:hypothetical protein
MSDEMKLKFDSAIKQMEFQLLQAKAALELKSEQDKQMIEIQKKAMEVEHAEVMSKIKQSEAKAKKKVTVKKTEAGYEMEESDNE